MSQGKAEPEPVDDPREGGYAAQVVEQEVKLAIGRSSLGVVLLLPGLAHRLDQLVRPVEVAPRDTKRRALCGVGLEQAAGGVDALHLVEVRLGDTDAAVRLADQKALGLELAHRLANGRDTRVETGSKLVLLDAGPARELPRADQQLQLVCNQVLLRLAVPRHSPSP